MQKPTLALIHGWGIGAPVWHPVSAQLAQHFDLQLFDLPGYGATPTANNTSFAQIATSLLADVPENTFLCGWSLGAMLAMQMALLAPQKIARLVLVGASPSFTQRDGWPQAQPPALLDGFCRAVELNAADTRQRFIALLNQGDRQARALTRSMTRSLAETQPPAADTLLAGLGWLRDVDLRAQVTGITTPTLIIHGANDPLMPLAAAHALQAQIAGAQLEVFADAAHAPFAHDPQRFSSLLIALLTTD